MEIINTLRRNRDLIIGVGLVVLGVIWWLLQNQPIDKTFPETLRHLVLLFMVLLGVHVLDRWFFRENVLRMVGKGIEATQTQCSALLDSVIKAGVEYVYCSREDARADINDAIKRAKRRICLLGVALSEKLVLSQILNTSRSNQRVRKKMRILLLNPYSKPGIYRTILESSKGDVREIVFSEEQRVEVFYKQRLHSDFNTAYQTVRVNPGLKNNVRFYSNDPLCWLVIVDDVLFFQPYTFGGRTPEDFGYCCIGDKMPVWRFSRKSRAFATLEDHFEKLWKSSDTDMALMSQLSKTMSAQDKIRKIVNAEKSYFEFIYTMLYEGGCDEPLWHECDRENIDAEMTVKKDSIQSRFKAVITQYSNQGLRVTLKEKQDGKELKKGTSVILLFTNPKESLNDLHAFGNVYKIVGFDKNTRVVELAVQNP